MIIEVFNSRHGLSVTVDPDGENSICYAEYNASERADFNAYFSRLSREQVAEVCQSKGVYRFKQCITPRTHAGAVDDPFVLLPLYPNQLETL